MLKRSIFIVLVSILNVSVPMYATQYSYEDDAVLSREERDYLKIKEAVFIKMGPDFAQSFNNKYPHYCRKGLKKLRKYIDKIPSTMLKTNPPQITVTIGECSVHLWSGIVDMLMSMREVSRHTITKVS